MVLAIGSIISVITFKLTQSPTLFVVTKVSLFATIAVASYAVWGPFICFLVIELKKAIWRK